jgi:hypothetical protein
LIWIGGSAAKRPRRRSKTDTYRFYGPRLFAAIGLGLILFAVYVGGGGEHGKEIFKG